MLRKIEMTNIRSYRGKVSIEFFKTTVIVGLNGSGKTSVIEALRYALTNEINRSLVYSPKLAQTDVHAKITVFFEDFRLTRSLVCFLKNLSQRSLESTINFEKFRSMFKKPLAKNLKERHLKKHEQNRKKNPDINLQKVNSSNSDTDICISSQSELEKISNQYSKIGKTSKKQIRLIPSKLNPDHDQKDVHLSRMQIEPTEIPIEEYHVNEYHRLILESADETKDRINQLRNQIGSVSSKLGDSMEQTMTILNTTPAQVLNICICHQDDQFWPLLDLKKRLDAILNTSGFSKLVDQLKIVKKGIIYQIELKERDLGHLNRLKKNLSAQKNEYDENITKVRDLQRELEDISNEYEQLNKIVIKTHDDIEKELVMKQDKITSLKGSFKDTNLTENDFSEFFKSIKNQVADFESTYGNFKNNDVEISIFGERLLMFLSFFFYTGFFSLRSKYSFECPVNLSEKNHSFIFEMFNFMFSGFDSFKQNLQYSIASAQKTLDSKYKAKNIPLHNLNKPKTFNTGNSSQIDFYNYQDENKPEVDFNNESIHKGFVENVLNDLCDQSDILSSSEYLNQRLLNQVFVKYAHTKPLNTKITTSDSSDILNTSLFDMSDPKSCKESHKLENSHVIFEKCEQIIKHDCSIYETTIKKTELFINLINEVEFSFQYNSIYILESAILKYKDLFGLVKDTVCTLKNFIEAPNLPESRRLKFKQDLNLKKIYDDLFTVKSGSDISGKETVSMVTEEKVSNFQFFTEYFLSQDESISMNQKSVLCKNLDCEYQENTTKTSDEAFLSLGIKYNDTNLQKFLQNPFPTTFGLENSQYCVSGQKFITEPAETLETTLCEQEFRNNKTIKSNNPIAKSTSTSFMNINGIAIYHFTKYHELISNNNILDHLKQAGSELQLLINQESDNKGDSEIVKKEKKLKELSRCEKILSQKIQDNRVKMKLEESEIQRIGADIRKIIDDGMKISTKIRSNTLYQSDISTVDLVLGVFSGANLKNANKTTPEDSSKMFNAVFKALKCIRSDLDLDYSSIIDKNVFKDESLCKEEVSTYHKDSSKNKSSDFLNTMQIFCGDLNTISNELVNQTLQKNKIYERTLINKDVFTRFKESIDIMKKYQADLWILFQEIIDFINKDLVLNDFLNELVISNHRNHDVVDITNYKAPRNGILNPNFYLEISKLEDYCDHACMDRTHNSVYQKIESQNNLFGYFTPTLIDTEKHIEEPCNFFTNPFEKRLGNIFGEYIIHRKTSKHDLWGLNDLFTLLNCGNTSRKIDRVIRLCQLIDQDIHSAFMELNNFCINFSKTLESIFCNISPSDFSKYFNKTPLKVSKLECDNYAGDAATSCDYQVYSDEKQIPLISAHINPNSKKKEAHFQESDVIFKCSDQNFKGRSRLPEISESDYYRMIEDEIESTLKSLEDEGEVLNSTIKNANHECIPPDYSIKEAKSAGRNDKNSTKRPCVDFEWEERPIPDIPFGIDHNDEISTLAGNFTGCTDQFFEKTNFNAQSYKYGPQKQESHKNVFRNPSVICPKENIQKTNSPKKLGPLCLNTQNSQCLETNSFLEFQNNVSAENLECRNVFYTTHVVPVTKIHRNQKHDFTSNEGTKSQILEQMKICKKIDSKFSEKFRASQGESSDNIHTDHKVELKFIKANHHFEPLDQKDAGPYLSEEDMKEIFGSQINICKLNHVKNLNLYNLFPKREHIKSKCLLELIEKYKKSILYIHVIEKIYKNISKKSLSMQQCYFCKGQLSNDSRKTLSVRIAIVLNRLPAIKNRILEQVSILKKKLDEVDSHNEFIELFNRAHSELIQFLDQTYSIVRRLLFYDSFLQNSFVNISYFSSLGINLDSLINETDQKILREHLLKVINEILIINDFKNQSSIDPYTNKNMSLRSKIQKSESSVETYQSQFTFEKNLRNIENLDKSCRNLRKDHQNSSITYTKISKNCEYRDSVNTKKDISGLKSDSKNTSTTINQSTEKTIKDSNEIPDQEKMLYKDISGLNSDSKNTSTTINQSTEITIKDSNEIPDQEKMLYKDISGLNSDSKNTSTTINQSTDKTRKDSNEMSDQEKLLFIHAFLSNDVSKAPEIKILDILQTFVCISPHTSTSASHLMKSLKNFKVKSENLLCLFSKYIESFHSLFTKVTSLLNLSPKTCEILHSDHESILLSLDKKQNDISTAVNGHNFVIKKKSHQRPEIYEALCTQLKKLIVFRCESNESGNLNVQKKKTDCYFSQLLTYFANFASLNTFKTHSIDFDIEPNVMLSIEKFFGLDNYKKHEFSPHHHKNIIFNDTLRLLSVDLDFFDILCDYQGNLEFIEKICQESEAKRTYINLFVDLTRCLMDFQKTLGEKNDKEAILEMIKVENDILELEQEKNFLNIEAESQTLKEYYRNRDIYRGQKLSAIQMTNQIKNSVDNLLSKKSDADKEFANMLNQFTFPSPVYFQNIVDLCTLPPQLFKRIMERLFDRVYALIAFILRNSKYRIPSEIYRKDWEIIFKEIKKHMNFSNHKRLLFEACKSDSTLNEKFWTEKRCESIDYIEYMSLPDSNSPNLEKRLYDQFFYSREYSLFIDPQSNEKNIGNYFLSFYEYLFSFVTILKNECSLLIDYHYTPLVLFLYIDLYYITQDLISDMRFHSTGLLQISKSLYEKTLEGRYTFNNKIMEIKDYLYNQNIFKEIEKLEQEMKSYDIQKIKKQKEYYIEHENRKNHILQRKYTLMGELKALKNKKLSFCQKDFDKVTCEHLRTNIELETYKLLLNDSVKCLKEVENRIKDFCAERISDINDLLKELWINTYRGNDIDSIKIDTEITEKTLNYNLVIIKNSVPLEMKSRASAGQKVLGCILFRIALCSVFNTSFKVLALDEPTTNLDENNIEALALTINSVIKRSNLQFILITHDMRFARMVDSEQDFCYYISRDHSGNSVIEMKKTA